MDSQTTDITNFPDIFMLPAKQSGTLLVIRFVTDLTQKYVGWKKPIEGETLASSPLWAFSTRHISV